MIICLFVKAMQNYGIKIYKKVNKKLSLRYYSF